MSRRRTSHTGDRRSRRVVGVVLAAIAIVSVAMTIAAAQTEAEEPEEEPGLVSRGAELYGEHCATCHGVDGRGTRDVPIVIDDASPALIDFLIRTGRMPLPHPDARMQRRDPTIDDDQRQAIVAYFRTFAVDEPEVPDPSPELGDVAHGRELYETHCIACHSPFGSGIAISQRDIAPALGPADPVEIAAAVRTGPGVMPVFSEEVLDDSDLDSTIAYLLFLRDRPQPGGLQLGRSGPVTDGYLAWFVGLGLMLVMAYFVGERREQHGPTDEVDRSTEREEPDPGQEVER